MKEQARSKGGNKGGIEGEKKYPKRDKKQYSNGMRFDVVVVLGMHRSGTSAITKGLELFGVDLGQNLLAGDENNPKGYFEDNQLITINDNILRTSGLFWSTLQFIEPADLLGPRFQKEQNEAREFLKGKLAQGTPIGLKDPRLCRTLPLWQKILVEMGVRVGYLLVFRDPFEIAASLKERDGMSVDYGLTLWGSYQTDALRHTEGKSRLFVGFHQLLANSERELARMSEFLETAWEPEAKSTLEYEKKFLESDLRHHQTKNGQTLEPAALQALALALDKVCQKSDKKELEDVENAGKEALQGMMQVSDLIRKNNQNLLRSNGSVELFYSRDLGVFSEERKFSRSLSITPGSQEVINVSLSGEVGLAPYWRLDPGCQPGIIHLLAMKFLDSKGHVVWDLQDHREQVLVQGSAVKLSPPPVGVEVVSTGNDPNIILPALPADALPISTIHIDMKIIRTQDEITQLFQAQCQKVAHFQRALGEKESQAAQMKSILEAKEKEIAQAVKIDQKIEQIRQEMKADREESKLVVKSVKEVWATSEQQNVSLQNTLSQIRQEMEQDRKESKLVVKKVEEDRASSEKQNLSLQNTLRQIRQEMAVDREESKLAVKKVEKEWTQQRKAQQEAVEKSVAEVKKEIVAEIQSLIANLVEQEEKNRLEVSARVGAVEEGMGGRIVEVGEYAAKIQKAVVSPSSYLIPAPFSWYSFLNKMLNIQKPIWLNKEKESGEAPKRPGFWRRLERRIRMRRKRWIGRIGFEREWYLKEYPDVARAGIDPIEHYISYGEKEGRFKSKKQQERATLKANRPTQEEHKRALNSHRLRQRTAFSMSKARLPFNLRREERQNPREAPPISILMPVHDAPQDILESTLLSVLNQTSSSWELIVVNDASKMPHVEKLLTSYAKQDSRIKYHQRKNNGGISVATNDALLLASYEYVAFVDHDDLLDKKALEYCSQAIATTGADAVYTDQDTIDANGQSINTFYKPDWSPEYLRHVMYVGHLLVVRRALAQAVGGFRSEFDGVQDFDFMLRFGEKTNNIAHIPKVLYHWRAIPGSLASSTDAKDGISSLQCRAVQEHIERMGVLAKAQENPKYPHRCVIVPHMTHFPKVSIVIPSKDHPELIGPCLASIYAFTKYPNFEVIVVDTGTTDSSAKQILVSHPVRLVKFSRPFNFSEACNVGARAATGDIFVFLNNDTTVVSPEWLHHFVFHLSVSDVGAVGPLLLFPDGTIQHAGTVLGPRGTADHVLRGSSPESDGYAGSLSSPREVSALTGACLAIRRDTFDSVDGWSEFYMTHYQDVDLCLQLRNRGLRCIFTPDVRLVHHESPSRGSRYDLLDRMLLIDSWQDVIEKGDPAYPRAFSLERLDYSDCKVAVELAHE
ncbi:MAG: glycosyltransferase [Burkholderiaceae bacterium]|nr:glycosyltransferase [Burkholderiaceae bacterium]